MGYGGWDDVFTRCLLNAIAEQSDEIEVLWTFFEKDEAAVIAKNQQLLQKLQTLPGQRVVSYIGVDCNKFLVDLEKDLGSQASSNTATVTNAAIQTKKTLYNVPAVPTWVGREKEIAALLESKAKVVALNGLGGFGKSALAATYFHERARRKDFSLVYWADCREQGNTVQTHLIAILDLITQGVINARSLNEANTADIIGVFLQEISKRRILIAFDNIDEYVDLETQLTVGTMQELLKQVLSTDHDSQLILTSRPKITYNSTKFLQIAVPGLSAADAADLFEKRGAKLDTFRKDQQVEAVLNLTQGSALHLNLIATQVAKQGNLDNLLARIEQGTAPEAQDRIFEEIWASLKEEQRKVLRYLAELPHPEPEQRVATCLNSELNHNRFMKAMKALRSLSLVVIRPGEHFSEALDLHPLVRAFIRKRFNKADQEPIVLRILSFLDSMISLFAKSSADGPTPILDNWTSKIELCINNGRAEQALETLYDIHVTLMMRGESEEFIRLTALLLPGYKVPDDPGATKSFDVVSGAFIDGLSQLGRSEETDKWLEILGKTVAGKSARYIWICKLRAHSYWLRGNTDEAIKWASEGVRLKSGSEADTDYDSSHTLALARRDSGDVESVLPYFLMGRPLQDIIDPKTIDPARGGAFYGNVGRCLFLMNKIEDSLTCFRKSASLLERTRDWVVPLNRGFAAKWIGDALAAKQESDNAYLAYRTAAAKWKNVSPKRAEDSMREAARLSEKVRDQTLLTYGDWECEHLYLRWLEKPQSS
jgi:tetratricopeptide (TPR) repeat protein